MNGPANKATKALAAAARRAGTEHYVLRLYVTGLTQRSTRAVETVRTICETHLRGRYELEVIDIYQQPALARDQQIVAAPTLIKSLPLPLRRIIGDLSNSERVLVGLGLERIEP
jgi:circadian clock protein KaiB